MQKLQNDMLDWSLSTFGNFGPISVIHHMKEECDELIEDPYDIMEYADVLQLLLDAAGRAGFSAYDIMEAAELKLKINKKREWHEPDENGVIRHKK